MRFALFLLLALLLAPGARASSALTEAEFRALANDLSGKVDIFAETWAQDPQAVFSGGTVRDYLYWLKGQFRKAETKEQAAAIAAELRSRPVLPVREFIPRESDIDVITAFPLTLEPRNFGVRKIDRISPELLDPTKELGQNEVHQGFLPAEKVRLGSTGIKADATFGDGVSEIFRGRPTAHFAEAAEFAATKYAREGLNHPVLLALRYLRLAAANYFREYGAGTALPEQLKETLDPGSVARAKAIIEHAAASGELKPYFEKPAFGTWLNASIKKSFESFTNPNAARLLMKDFGADRLAEAYGDKIAPFYHYVFAKERDPAAVAKNLRALGADAATLYRSPAAAFSDGFLYHGTRDEESFRAILFYGALPSGGGSAGEGLYGVNKNNLALAEGFAGDKKRMVRIPLKQDAKIVDITTEPGAGLFEKYKLTHPKATESEFADAVGADILRYPYGENEAYVVKNSRALGEAEGVYRRILPLHQLKPALDRAQTLSEFLDLADANSFPPADLARELQARQFPDAAYAALFRAEEPREDRIRRVQQLSAHPWLTRDENLRPLLQDPEVAATVVKEVLTRKEAAGQIPETFRFFLAQKNPALNLALLQVVEKNTAWMQHPDLVVETILGVPSGPYYTEFVNRTIGLFAPADVTPMPKPVLQTLMAQLRDPQDFHLSLSLLSHPYGRANEDLVEELVNKNYGRLGLHWGLSNPHWNHRNDLRIAYIRNNPKDAEGFFDLLVKNNVPVDEHVWAAVVDTMSPSPPPAPAYAHAAPAPNPLLDRSQSHARVELARRDPQRALEILRQLPERDLAFANQLLANPHFQVAVVAHLQGPGSAVWLPLQLNRFTSGRITVSEGAPARGPSCDGLFAGLGRWWKSRRIYELFTTGKVNY